MLFVFRRSGIPALLVAVLALASAGCDVQPAEIPVPGSGVGGQTYHLRIEFADVLNLPRGAKVIADGVRVGELTDVTLVDAVAAQPDRPAVPGHVVADVEIAKSAHLPVGTTAELRQETPLGDVHIALTAPPAATAMLAPDATIPLSDTSQSPPIEDIMARLAVFVGSGAISDLQAIVHKLNGVMPQDPRDTARIAGILGGDFTDLADNQNSIHNLVAGLQATVDDGLLSNTPDFDQLLTTEGVQHTTDSIETIVSLLFVLTALGPLAPTLAWLGPLLQSLDGTARAAIPMLFGARPLDTTSPSNLKKLMDLIHNKIIPFADRGPKVNLVGIGSPEPAPAMSPEEQTGRIIDVLRMIGAVR
ncbi:ABC-type transporter Mla subunit MlaD [Nocardia transvalensis]|uniref:ABC-type transporter Mla subunit MlaD n=1 Tax=Nocardia transvalensis TaxID=37333 RepID=A0A7W9PHD8_9NOCA|nr:MlaD family protein [Nocardia transvalensis]MBB5915955.1 ABC-type transporter Mla subunit MlaD [Nocardia transvalensis]